MCDRILTRVPNAGGSRKGESSILGGIGDLIGGSRAKSYARRRQEACK